MSFHPSYLLAGLASAMPTATDGKILLAVLCVVAAEATAALALVLTVRP